MNWERKFKSDHIIIMGSGGGRYICRTQHRSTGGIIFRVVDSQIQCHLDPGPGAIRDVNDYGIDPSRTKYIFLTHMHTDHFMSIPIIIESAQSDPKYRIPSGTLVAPRDFYRYLEPYYQQLLERTIIAQRDKRYVLEENFKIKRVTQTLHGKVENYGYIFEIGNSHEDYNYTLAFTSDTAYFSEYIDIYKGVDILVANVLRPDNMRCRGHLSVDEFIPLLKEIAPKICILTHFGGFMDSPKLGNKVPEQISKIRDEVGNRSLVLGAADGMRIDFARLLNDFEAGGAD